MAHTATNTAVHVACSEMAFRPMEAPTIADPTTKIMTELESATSEAKSWHCLQCKKRGRLTSTVDGCEDLPTDFSKEYLTDVDHTVYRQSVSTISEHGQPQSLAILTDMSMLELESTNNPSGPSSDQSDGHET